MHAIVFFLIIIQNVKRTTVDCKENVTICHEWYNYEVSQGASVTNLHEQLSTNESIFVKFPILILELTSLVLEVTFTSQNKVPVLYS